MGCHSPHQEMREVVGKLDTPESTRTGGWAQQKPVALVFCCQL